MRFERTFDYQLVGSLIRNPKLWSYFADDFSGPMEEFKANQDPRLWYVLVRDGDELLGLFALSPLSPILFDFHTVMPLDGRCLRAARQFFGPGGWLWANSTCLRAITFFPAGNRIARRCAQRAGLQAYGVNPCSYLKGGELQDQILMGISKR